MKKKQLRFVPVVDESKSLGPYEHHVLTGIAPKIQGCPLCVAGVPKKVKRMQGGSDGRS